MKGEAPNSRQEAQTALREQILQSMIASFKIEGIIPAEAAKATLKKIEISLGKQR